MNYGHGGRIRSCVTATIYVTIYDLGVRRQSIVKLLQNSKVPLLPAPFSILRRL